MSARPRYRREDSPPEGGPLLKLFRLKANESANFSILGSIVHGYWTHWTGRTDPCIDPKDDCPGCKAQAPQRWKGYVYCMRDDRQEDGFLELTRAGKAKLVGLAGGDRYLRGSRFKVLRGKGEKTQLTFLMLRGWHAEFPEAPMPEERDPEETLRVLFEWRRAKKEGGSANV